MIMIENENSIEDAKQAKANSIVAAKQAIENSIVATKQAFENSFSSGDFYNKQTQDEQHLKLILEFLPIKYGMKILDLGTGSGYLAFFIAEKYPNKLDEFSKLGEVIYRSHNTISISIFGDRGVGKTSFLLSMQKISKR